LVFLLVLVGWVERGDL